MQIASKIIHAAGETFELTNRRAAFWKREKALIFSDLHVGKAAHFRKNGIALGSQMMQADLRRLEKLIGHFQPEKLIIVGDLLHAGNNSEVDEFCSWKNTFQDVQFCLVEGNHDRISKKLDEKLCLDLKTDKLVINNIMFVHDHQQNEKIFQITGHIHPGFTLRTAVSRIKLPCFVQTENQLLLPAFSEFTGLDTKSIPKKAKYFIFTPSEIHEV